MKQMNLSFSRSALLSKISFHPAGRPFYAPKLLRQNQQHQNISQMRVSQSRSNALARALTKPQIITKDYDRPTFDAPFDRG